MKKKTLHHIASLAILPGPVHGAIGFFDGVHLGHQEVIHRAQAAAEPDGGTASHCQRLASDFPTPALDLNKLTGLLDSTA